jgi:hypothetical protein
VEKHLAVANEKLLAARLQRLGVTQRPVPVHAIRRVVESDEAAFARWIEADSVRFTHPLLFSEL